MKFDKSSKLLAVIGCLPAVAAIRECHASIFASVDLEQVIGYSVPGQFSEIYAPVSDSAVPFNATSSLNTGAGSGISTTFGLYDNGTSAGLSILTSANVADVPGTGLSETTQNGFYPSDKTTTFSFNEPVKFSLIVSGSGSVIAGVDAASGEVNFPAPFPNPGYYLVPGGNAGASYTSPVLTGFLSAGTPYTLDNFWNIGVPSTATQTSPPITGTESIVFTFTPVPEPSSAVLAAAAAGLLRQRGRTSGGRQ